MKGGKRRCQITIRVVMLIKYKSTVLIANQLAADYHLDVSQVLFTYLKVAEPILAKQTHTKQISEATQKQIDEQFEQTLLKLSHTKEWDVMCTSIYQIAQDGTPRTGPDNGLARFRGWTGFRAPSISVALGLW